MPFMTSDQETKQDLLLHSLSRVILVNENENGEKQENNEFLNKN